MLRMGVVVGMIAVSCGAGCGPRLVTEAEMKDRAAITRIAGDVVKTKINRHAKLIKVAIIGVNANRATARSHGGGFGYPGSGIVRAVETVNQISDMAKQVTCRALDAAFDSFQPALEAAGIGTVSAAEKLDTDQYRAVSENQGGSLLCVATKARISIMALGLSGVSSMFGGGGASPVELMHSVTKLMDELGVDGVLMAFLNSDGMAADNSIFVLFMKRPDGLLQPTWQAELKKDTVKFEPVVAKPHGDEDKVQNITRVYQHSFELLAAKLAADGK